MTLPGTDYDPADFEELDVEALRDDLARACLDYSEREVREWLREALAEAGGRRSVPFGLISQLDAIDWGEWAGREPPERVSLWGSWLPARQTTMLTGRGGIGKSLFAQCLVTSTALGLSFLGMPTVASRCLYVTAEDDPDELWRRQRAICDARGIDMAQLRARLFLVSLAGEAETALGTFDVASGRLKTTDLWEKLQGTVAAQCIRLAVFDNATDAMAGDLNDLHQVAEFVNLTTGLAIRMDGSFLMLHHPNKAGDDWLGSVAWHNKVRSRLIIEAGSDPGDPDARVIRNPKANYGPQDGKLLFRWHDGAFVGDAEISADDRGRMAATARAAGDNLTFLACLDLMTKQERAVSASPSNTYVPAVFASLTESKGIGKPRLEQAMNRLLGLGLIERGELPWRRPDRHQAIGLRRTAGDGAGNPAGNGAGNVRETVTKGADFRAGDVAAITPPPKGGEGAAPEGPAAHSSYPDFDPFDPDGGARERREGRGA